MCPTEGDAADNGHLGQDILAEASGGVSDKGGEARYDGKGLKRFEKESRIRGRRKK